MSNTNTSKNIDLKFQRMVQNMIVESIKETLQNEDRRVKFNNNTYPKFGQAVVMVGGAGSGKTFALDSGLIPIDAKHFDTDEFKKKYIQLQSKPNSVINREDTHQYDLKNSEDVSALHWKVKGKGWDWKTQDAFMYDETHDPQRLPNVVFDITGKDVSKMIDIAQTCKEMGYEITLVWVVVNRSRALWNNLNRSRNVKQDVFHSIHNKINEVVPNFIKQDAGKYFDNAWLVFNSTETLGAKTEEDEKNTAVSLEKNGNGFIIDDTDAERLYRMLGEDEPNPSNPQKYKSYDEILQGQEKPNPLYRQELPRRNKETYSSGYKYNRTDTYRK